MLTNIKVKIEPGEGGGEKKEKLAGQGKFKPKIPIKKKVEIVDEVDNNNVKTQTTTNSNTNIKNQDNQQQDSTQSKKRDNTNKSQDLKGQNRQKWTMPIGQSFFMSQKNSITNKKTKSNTTTSNDSNKATTNATTNNNNNNSNNQVKILVPPRLVNEQQILGNPLIPDIPNTVYPMGMRRIIDDDDDNNMNNRMMGDHINTGSYTFGPYEDDDLIDTDSGTESSDSDDDMDVDPDVEEIWPPQKYDLLEPLSLPLGPTTAIKRDELERQAIIYHPNDYEALEREKSDIFLLQFPSDLCLKSNIIPIEINEDKDDDAKLLDGNDDKYLKEAKKVEGKIGPGKLGKLQLTRSGRVFLVTDSGYKFEVNNGITTCFSNFVAAIKMNDNNNNPNIESNISDRKDKKMKSNDKKETVIDTPVCGQLSVLGRVTKKLGIP